MSIKIRLTRTGKKKQPHYRVVVADSLAPRDGSYLEQVGYYNPRNKPSDVRLKTDRVQHWLDKGAQPTETVAKLLKKEGLWPKGSGVKTSGSASAPEQPST